MVWLALIALFFSLIMGGVILRCSRGLGKAYGEGMPQRIHSGEIPRLGGIALLVGVFISWSAGVFSSNFLGDPSSLKMGSTTWVIFFTIIPVVFAGIAEDVTQKIRISYRLLFSFFSAFLAVFFLDLGVTRIGFEPLDNFMLIYPWVGIVIAILAISGLPHAFNIIDGCNGLAGMVAIIICLALAYVSLQVGDRELAALMISTAAAALGFLFWNYPRGLLFAGDGGAYLWGVIIAIASVLLVSRHPQVSPWFAMLLLIYPVWETMFSIYRKLMRGMSPGIADALHFHQLIYRRVVWGVFDDNESRDMLIRNNRTSPYLWAFTLLSVIPAILFWRNTLVLVLCCFLFVFIYVYAYFSIVRFKIPGWFQN